MSVYYSNYYCKRIKLRRHSLCVKKLNIKSISADIHSVKWLNQFLNYILFFTGTACVGIFGYVYFNKTNSVPAAKPAVKQSQLTPDELVNKYLKQTQTDLQRQQQSSVRIIKNQIIEAAKNVEKEISPDTIPIELQIAKDNSYAIDKTLTETFDQRSYESQMLKIQSEQAKKQYAKEYIENAKKDGYQITLTDDLQIKSVKPLRRPTNQQNDNDTFESEPSN